jgi:hypothetical protein
MSERHGQIIRGLTNATRSRLLSGRFGRMFRSLAPTSFGATDAETHDNLLKLGEAMSAAFEEPKDGKDDEESGIPALYTYFGQFVDHDLTFDPASSLQKQNDPDALVDYRTPAFDLDNLYGRGSDDQPYMYDGQDPRRLLVGNPIGEGGATRDLPRASNGRAIIGDPRNDENEIVSQLHGLFIQFHNRMAEDHKTFAEEEVQKLVRFHYQYVVINDYLERIVHSRVLEELKTGERYDPEKIKFFKWRNEPFMPVEFSAAAYRFGHSMVRPGYRLNDGLLLPIFPSPRHDLRRGLTGFRPLEPDKALDWGRFIDVGRRPYDGGKAENERRLQFAYRIDTSLVNPLAHLPSVIAGNRPHSLAQRNLLRGWRLGLPSGQQVARAMGVPVLSDQEILIGKATGNKGDAVSITDKALGLSDVFADNCPLWTYILAEAIKNQEPVEIPVEGKRRIETPRLGPVGGRIVAEVFLGLMFGDPNSLLRVDRTWRPERHDYALKDFVRYGLGA